MITINPFPARRLTYYVKYATEVEQVFANRWFTEVTKALQSYIEQTGEKVIIR